MQIHGCKYIAKQRILNNRDFQFILSFQCGRSLSLLWCPHSTPLPASPPCRNLNTTFSALILILIVHCTFFRSSRNSFSSLGGGGEISACLPVIASCSGDSKSCLEESLQLSREFLLDRFVLRDLT